jgi:hypothetical protein
VGRHDLGDGWTLVHLCASSCDTASQLLLEDHVVHLVRPEEDIERSVDLSLERAYLTFHQMANLVASSGLTPKAVMGGFDGEPFTSTSSEMIWVLQRE